MENYLDLKDGYNHSKIQKPANIIKNGGIIIFPTETVYAIGANAFDENAVKKLYIAKGRNFKNPINVLVSSIDMIKNVSRGITSMERKLIHAFFPGPFTIILQKNESIPNIVTANSDSIGVRMPDNNIAKTLIELSNVPLAAPSANISGKTSGTSFDNVYEDFKNKVDFFIDGGNCSIGIESTIVKVIDEVPHILRPGSITAEQIQAITNTIVVKDYNSSNNSNLPSENLNHYKLSHKSILIYGQDNNVLINNILKIANDYSNPIIVSSNKNIDNYMSFKHIGLGNSLEEIAKNLFLALKEADNQNPDIIIIEGMNQIGIGEAIMNRLVKCCDKYIKL